MVAGAEDSQARSTIPVGYHKASSGCVEEAIQTMDGAPVGATRICRVETSLQRPARSRTRRWKYSTPVSTSVYE